MNENRSSTVSARMSPEEVKLLRDVAKARGEGISSFIRKSIRRELAILSYLTDDDCKALAIKKEVSA
jgi:uncharacterized protein (DUF1778 family)